MSLIVLVARCLIISDLAEARLPDWCETTAVSGPVLRRDRALVTSALTEILGCPNLQPRVVNLKQQHHEYITGLENEPSKCFRALKRELGVYHIICCRPH